MEEALHQILQYIMAAWHTLCSHSSLFAYNAHEPMMFTTGLFVMLFAVFYAIYGCLNRATTLRLLFVVCFSYYFYYKSSGCYFLLLALVTVSDFLIARRMADADEQIGRAHV